jgi:hypothetical protein
MFRMDIEELKLVFVMSVYDSVTKQIQQLDLKSSFILSWNGVIGVLLSHEFALIVHADRNRGSLIMLALAVVCSLIVSGFYCYKVLRPRVGAVKERFDGLLWAGDIQKLGLTHADRIAVYMKQLIEITTHDKLYEQFVTSIVLISEILLAKHKSFRQALFATAISFSLLLSLMAIAGLNL